MPVEATRQRTQTQGDQVTRTLSAKQARQIERYVRHLTKDLGLEGWKIDVLRDMDDIDDPAFARIDFYGPRRYARITVREDFYDFGSETHRVTLLHEVLHCHLGGPLESTAIDLHGVVDDSLATLAQRIYIERMEWAADALSVALADKFPLPEFTP